MFFLSLPSWWRARNAALKALEVCVFHNSLQMMILPGAQSRVVNIVLDRIVDKRLEVRVCAANVFSSLLHIGFVEDRSGVRNKFISKLSSRKARTLLAKSSALQESDQLPSIHGAVLGLTAFVSSAPYSITEDMPDTLCRLADYNSLPDPFRTSVRLCLSDFKRTHYDNWQQHKQHFTTDQLDIISDVLLSPSYYA